MLFHFLQVLWNLKIILEFFSIHPYMSCTYKFVTTCVFSFTPTMPSNLFVPAFLLREDYGKMYSANRPPKSSHIHIHIALSLPSHLSGLLTPPGLFFFFLGLYHGYRSWPESLYPLTCM